MGFRWPTLFVFPAALAVGLVLPAVSSAGEAKKAKADSPKQASSPSPKTAGTAAEPKSKAEQGSGQAAAPAAGGTRRGAGGKVLRFDTLKIEGEHETPDVIIIQEWTPPKDQVIEDKASDDLDKVFSGIRSLNRGFSGELMVTPDAETISAESKARDQEQKLYQREKPQNTDRNRKTSLR